MCAKASQPVIGPLKSSPLIQRYSGNPVLAAKDIPYKATLIFNAGITKFHGRYVMAFRNDYFRKVPSPRLTSISIGLAFSNDGIHWQVEPKPCFEMRDEEVISAYDPRLTVLGDRCYMCFAVDTRHGVRGGVAVTDDFRKFEILTVSTPDNRNMVLFPEKVGGLYVRLERPFPVYSRGGDRFDVWLSYSPDLKYWGDAKLVLAVEDVPFANNKIGPGAPPVKTPQGWLTTFHAVDLDLRRRKNGWESTWKKRYSMGIMLLDLKNPAKVIGLYREPLLAPEASYEIHGGYRNNVIFPGGMVLEKSGEVKIYYGAADTVECLATAQVGDLLSLCAHRNLPRHQAGKH